MADNPELVAGEPGQGLIITPAKKLIIEALRETFTSLYPNTSMASMNINMEYPYKTEHYPGIWVRFSPHKIQSSGLQPARQGDGEIFSVWYFEGTFNLVIIALTSKERDLISDGVIEAYAFAALMPSASPFYTKITNSDLINMSLQQDILTAGGQTETIGTPWDDDKIAYEDRYSFEVVGQVRSRVQNDVVFTTLSEVQTFATVTNVEGAPDNSPPDDDDGTWQ